MEYKIPVKEGGLYKAILLVMDPFLELTAAERHVLSEILKLQPRTLTSATRAKLKEQIGFNKYSINNHIKSLKDKGLLVETGHRELSVNPNVEKMVEGNTITIHFIEPQKNTNGSR
jgi:biotin operon repressor